MRNCGTQETSRVSITAEQDTLGSIFASKGAVLPECRKQITDRHFSYWAHQVVYRVMIDLGDQGIPIDLGIVTRTLADKNLLEKIGGAAFVTGLYTNTVPTAANIDYYLETLRDKYRRRTLFEGAETLLKMDAANETTERVTEYAGSILADEAGSLNSFNSSFVEDEFPQPIASEGFYGVAGEIVRRIEPHTEADPAALLFQLLVAFGNLIGRFAHIIADGAYHYTNLFCVLVGQSAKARKGTSLAQVFNVLGRIDDEWRRNRVFGGLSSGEGLINAVRDPTEDDAGVFDKRLLVVENEFANVLKNTRRETNILSPILRQAWDDGNLRTLTKNAPIKATDAHISAIGHITREENRRQLNQTESANGFANRFLWIAVKRSKYLPEGGQINPANFNDVIVQLQRAITKAREVGELRRNEAARELWRECYPRLSEGRPGLLGSITGRAEAQVTRLSILYALLDCQKEIAPAHHTAAVALWKYCEQSASWIFGNSTGDKNADKLIAALRQSGTTGLSKTEINTKVFGRNLSKEVLTEVLQTLHRGGYAKPVRESTAGAPIERWFLI